MSTATPPITSTARGLWLVLEAAEHRCLPMPMNAGAWESGRVTLQFHTRAEVHTWAAALDAAEVVDDIHTHGDGINDTTRAAVSWFDVPLDLVASVPRQPRSAGVA